MAEGEILRFPALQKSVNQFIEEQKNKQTLSKAKRDVGLLFEFLKSKQESRKIEEIQSQELNDFLSEFIVTVTVYSNCFYCSTELERIKRVLDSSDEDSPPAVPFQWQCFVKAFLLIVLFGVLGVI